MEITALMVKELRDLTGAGMLDAKKALVEAGGDIEAAVKLLREKGLAAAAKKSGRIAAEGLSNIYLQGNKATIIEMNSETDFAANSDKFAALVDVVGGTIIEHSPKTLEEALQLPVGSETIEAIISQATATIGEKITLRRFEVITKNDDEIFGSYIHMGGKISAISVLKKTDPQVAKDVAMQVASMNPSFIMKSDISEEFIVSERAVQTEIAKNDESLSGKPEKVIQGIIEGRLSKTLSELCLLDQKFFKDPSLTIQKYLEQNKTETTYFVRYAVGEGIEKREDNFAEEVMSQAFGK